MYNILELNDLQENVLQRALQFSDELLAPEAAERDQNEAFAAEHLKSMGRAGLLGVNVSQEYGGLGAGVVAYVFVCVLCACWQTMRSVTRARSGWLQRWRRTARSQDST